MRKKKAPAETLDPARLKKVREDCKRRARNLRIRRSLTKKSVVKGIDASLGTSTLDVLQSKSIVYFITLNMGVWERRVI